MSCLGVHFALSDEDAAKLLAARSDERVLSIITGDIEARWDKEWLQETEKSWDAIHRCLTDGTLACKNGEPLTKCILGGRQLYRGADYIVSFLDPTDVWAVAATIKDIDKEWIRRKYDGLDPSEYGPFKSEEDFEYTWSYFEEVKRFFAKAAAARRSVVFTADQ